jgi:hypothetical protein
MVVDALKSAEFVAERFVVVALVPVASENESVPPLMSVAFRVVIVPVVAESAVVFSAVEVTFVKVAFVPTMF